MQSKPIYLILGAITGAIVDLLINLIAAGIQQHAFANQFGIQAILGLAFLALVGLLIGYWLGKPIQVPRYDISSSQSLGGNKPDTVTMTRLRAFWSYNKLKGRGIHLDRVTLFGSTNEIDTD